MSGIRKILVVVDPTAGAPQAAVTKAAAIARRCGAEVELVACQRSIKLLGEPRNDRALKLLDELGATLLAGGVHAEKTVIRGPSLHRALLTHIKVCHADWVVKGTHAHRLSSRFFSRSTDWHLIDECPVPILLAKSRDWAGIPVVLAAIDPGGDPESLRRDPKILDISFRLTRLLQGVLHVVHAYQPPAKVQAMTNPSRNAALAPLAFNVDTDCEERERQYAEVSEFVRSCSIQPQDLHVDMGSAASYLPHIASEAHADIVVIGANSPGSAIPVVHDGVAARVLDGLPCDLLVLRAASRSGLLEELRQRDGRPPINEFVRPTQITLAQKQ